MPQECCGHVERISKIIITILLARKVLLLFIRLSFSVLLKR